MELEIVTFEQAKILKELGYPQTNEHIDVYDENGELWGGEFYFDTSYAAPPLELVAKWLREEKDLSITVSWMPNVKKYSCICSDMNYVPKKNSYNEAYKTYKENFEVTVNGEFKFDSYEKALSAGIDKAIKMLKG